MIQVTQEEKDTEEYAFYAKKLWEKDKTVEPMFIVLESSFSYMENHGIYSTFKDAKESIVSLVNRGRKKGYTFDGYSIHSISYPIPLDAEDE